MTSRQAGERRVRVGAVSYLNTKPLIYRFRQLAPRADLILDVPSALVQILLRERYDIRPQIYPLPLDQQAIPALPFLSGWSHTDAVLLIGDRAIHAPRDAFAHQWDLGEQWCCWTGLPFVFAMWTARGAIETEAIEPSLRQSRDAGLAHLRAIAQSAAPQVRLKVDTCLSYLRDNLHFTLGETERRGLQLFRHYAVRHGFAPAESTLETSGRVDS